MGLHFAFIKIIKRFERTLRNKYYAVGTVFIFACIAYCNSFSAPFLLDDFGSITNNHAIRKLFNFADLWKFYANRIVLYFTLSINYAIHDNMVEGYHIANLFIHILNGVLFRAILKKLLTLPYFKGKIASRYSNLISVMAAVIFVCHPIQVNSVTYIIQRTASLAATFYLLAILFFLCYRVHDKWRYLLFTFISVGFAMFTKENTITIPFMLLLLERMFFWDDRKTGWRKRLLIFLPLFATLPIIPATNLFLRGYSQSDPNVTFKASTSMDRFQYFYTQLNVILLYIRLMFIPIGQNFDYSNDFPLSAAIWDNYSYISFIVLFLTGLFSIYAWKRNRLVSLGIMWFFTGLAVESTFISIKDVYFEHRLYFPSAGFVLFLIGMITYERKKRKNVFRNPIIVLTVLSLALIPVYTGITIYRNYIYSDSIRLWTDTANKAPLSDRAHNSLATAYLNAYEEKKNNTSYLDQAEAEFKIAISLNDNNNTAHTNLSKVYLLRGDYHNCIIEAKRSLGIAKSEYAWFNLGSAYKKTGRTSEALSAFHEGYNFNSHSGFILYALGETYYETGDYTNAKRYYEEYIDNDRWLENSDVQERLKQIRNMLKTE